MSPPLSTLTNVLSWLLVVTSSPGCGTASSVSLCSPGDLRDVAQLDRQELAVGRGADRLLGDDFHLARRRLEEHADREYRR